MRLMRRFGVGESLIGDLLPGSPQSSSCVVQHNNSGAIRLTESGPHGILPLSPARALRVET
jgi:hypothetical protein